MLCRLIWMKCLFTQSQVVEREMCEVSRVLWQDQQASWQGVPHVLVPRYVREHAVLYDLRGQRKKDTAGCQEQSEWRWGGVFRLHCEVAVCSSRISPAPHSLVFLLSCWMSVSELKCKLRRSSRPDTLAHTCTAIPSWNAPCTSHYTPTGGVHVAATPSSLKASAWLTSGWLHSCLPWGGGSPLHAVCI